VILTVSIKEDKSYYWTTGSEVDVDTVDDSAVSLDEMVRAASAVLAANKAQGKQVQVYVRADKRVDYGSVMQAMGGLQQAGVTDVGLITEPL
ncbi:MAG: biopolymer transporter ExbD, partial [Thiopseudomonas sp.]